MTLLIVLAILAGASILVSRVLHDRETGEAHERERAVAAAAAISAERELSNYIDSLGSIAAYLGAADHSNASLTQYLDDTGFFEENPGYAQVAVVEIAHGAEGLAALEARERRTNPDFSVLAPSPTSEVHYVMTRLAGADEFLPYLGFDLAFSAETSAELDAGLAAAELTRGSINLDAPGADDPQRGSADEGLRDAFLESELVDISVVLQQPVVRQGEIVAFVMAQGDTAPVLERVLAGQPDQTTLELSLQGESIASTGNPPPDSSTAVRRSIRTGALDWSISATSSVTPNHTISQQALILGAAMTLTIGLILHLVIRNAETTGRLRESQIAANRDSLTGLANRRGITEELRSRLDNPAPGSVDAVLFCDLDQMKVVNDSMGHTAGDDSLRAVGSRIDACVGASDFVGRFGGDEFVVMCRVAEPEMAEAIGKRILDALTEPVKLANGTRQVLTASIGIAFGGANSTPDSLLRDADVAMYAAKTGGRARYELFDISLRTKAIARLEVEQDLRHGLESGDVIAYYQGIVDATTGETVAAEALARWIHPERGIVSPNDFIPVAEESGLINQLGAQMLHQAIAQVAIWQRQHEHRPLRVAVNVADRQIMTPSFVDEVAEALELHGVAPDSIELELSENLLMEGFERRMTVLKGLQRLGVRISIDDFGTGRASMGHLRKLDMVSTLKIDQTFIRHIDMQPVDREIVRAVATLAKSMDMTIVAEGVEKPAQVEILRDFGVDLLQGFLFSRPSPPEDVLKLAPLLHRPTRHPLRNPSVDASAG